MRQLPLHTSSHTRLVSTSADISESVKPSSWGLPEPNRRHMFEVPFKYRSIHLTGFHCSLPGLLMNRLTTPTAYPISDRVHTIPYIKLLTAKAYGTFIISAFSDFVFGLSLPDNLQFAGSVDSTGFASDMLNRCSTFVTYLSCDSHNCFFDRSRMICIPSMRYRGLIQSLLQHPNLGLVSSDDQHVVHVQE